MPSASCTVADENIGDRLTEQVDIGIA